MPSILLLSTRNWKSTALLWNYVLATMEASSMFPSFFVFYSIDIFNTLIIMITLMLCSVMSLLNVISSFLLYSFVLFNKQSFYQMSLHHKKNKVLIIKLNHQLMILIRRGSVRLKRWERRLKKRMRSYGSIINLAFVIGKDRLGHGIGRRRSGGSSWSGWWIEIVINRRIAIRLRIHRMVIRDWILHCFGGIFHRVVFCR